MARDSNLKTHLLLDIPFSHYCEKARWAFAYYGISYSQQLLLPLLHRSTIKRIVHDPAVRKTKTASRETRYSVPLLIVRDSDLNPCLSLHDSHDILVYLSETYSSPSRLNLYTSCGSENEEDVVELERHYDEVLGVATRACIYYDLLVMNKWHSAVPFAAIGFTNRCGIVNSLTYALLSPLIGRVIPLFLGLTREYYEGAMQICRNEFQQASERLEHSEYLCGSQLSASDITFAALAYPVLGITHSEGFTKFPPSPGMYGSEAKALRKELRATKAGQHVIRLYRAKQKLDAGIVVRKKRSLLGLW